jgi:hypothetical protein
MGQEGFLLFWKRGRLGCLGGRGCRRQLGLRWSRRVEGGVIWEGITMSQVRDATNVLEAHPWLYNPTDPSTFVPLRGPHPVTLRMNFRNSLCHTSSVNLTANNILLTAHVLAVNALFQLGEVRKLGKGFFWQVLRVERRKIWCLLNLINERDPSSHSLRNSCGQQIRTL